jgi:hypothetical protein
MRASAADSAASKEKEQHMAEKLEAQVIQRIKSAREGIENRNQISKRADPNALGKGSFWRGMCGGHAVRIQRMQNG